MSLWFGPLISRHQVCINLSTILMPRTPQQRQSQFIKCAKIKVTSWKSMTHLTPRIFYIYHLIVSVAHYTVIQNEFSYCFCSKLKELCKNMFTACIIVSRNNCSSDCRSLSEPDDSGNLRHHTAAIFLLLVLTGVRGFGPPGPPYLDLLLHHELS